jgi:hypothetical protein
MRFLSVGLILAGVLAAPAAVAECECFCVNGALQTLCTTVEEAQSNVNRCAGRAPSSCPVDLDAPTAEQYPAPADDATNCRDVQVYDAGAGQHTAVKVCDVVPSA